MNSKAKGAVVAAFVADALSLGVHWVYNTADIDKTYGRLDQMVTPVLAPYHASKKKGDFTHYGDQMLVLLESLVQASGFDLAHFSRKWQKLFQSYTGYLDHATKETLKQFESGAGPDTSGSASSDLAGASRIAPLAFFHADDVDAFVAAARSQTAMTHNHPLVIESAVFFAGTSALILDGASPVAALEKSLESTPDESGLHRLVTAGINSRSADTRTTIATFGQTCSIGAALPSAIHLIAKYEDNLKEALIENIMAGGDSSARGILAGFILGCHQGLDHIPVTWLDDMAAYPKIVHWLQ